MPAEIALELQPLPASGLPTPVPAPPPNHKNLPRFYHSAFTQCMCQQCGRAFRYVWACIEIVWAKLQNIWNATRRKYALSTWLAIGISVIIGGLGLRYAYIQVLLSYEALRLAKWTARKDFWELCQEQKVCRESVTGHRPQDADQRTRSQIIHSVSTAS